MVSSLSSVVCRDVAFYVLCGCAFSHGVFLRCGKFVCCAGVRAKRIYTNNTFKVLYIWKYEYEYNIYDEVMTQYAHTHAYQCIGIWIEYVDSCYNHTIGNNRALAVFSTIISSVRMYALRRIYIFVFACNIHKLTTHRYALTLLVCVFHAIID